jgi:glycerophosphoryl diester phosphodiesterase
MKGFKDATQLTILVALVVACHAMRPTDQPRKMKPKDTVTALPVFDKEGHRGCRGLMPENTIPAMIKAVDIGVTTLEMDAVITKDGQVLLSHDPVFNHIIATRPDGQPVDAKEEHELIIYQMTYEETQGYDVGKRPHPQFPQQQRLAATKPLLSKVIDTVETYVKQKKVTPVFYNIETKCQPSTDNKNHPAPEEFVDKLVTVVLLKGIKDRVIIQSFDFRTLQVLHKKYPAIKTAALIQDKRTLDEHLAALGFTPTIYSPAYMLVTPEMVKQCHQKNIKIIPWTANDKETIDKLKAMGVDGIISDYPNLL